MLGFSYARFVINTDCYRSNEMYMAELLYTVIIDDVSTYTLTLEAGAYEGGTDRRGLGDYGTGGGGSGYIGNTLLVDKIMYCYNCATSNDESTKTVSNTCANSSPTENCSKIGNGYARITYLGTSLN